MIFFLVMPGLFGGFGNYFVVIFQGSPEVVYPRVNNFSILILSLSYLFLILSLISEFGGGTGWTLYPPLSTSFMSLSPSSTGNIILGLLISGISSCLTSINFWTTILNLRSYYLTLKTMPLFPWALFITGGMLLFTLPILSGALLMVLADLHSNTLFFDPIFGGDPIFYQHLFWFFGHPEVYILIIPAFGIISIIISGILQKIIFGNPSMIFAMSCISLLGSVVWGHHMYTVGLETDTRAYFSGVTILISLPTGTKIFNWLSTYLGNPALLQLKTNSPFFGLLFLLMFTIGGSTGIILGNAAVDLGLHDTYYVVAHFHFVLSLGAVIAIFSGVIFNGEKIVGSKNLLPSSSSRNSLFHLVSTFIGILITFSPFHFLGFNVMPRRIPDFPDSFHSWNFLSSIGSGITLLSFGLLFHESSEGQMSFWGATVITNLLSPFPSLIEWVSGGHYVYNPTLKRFFLFHFILPFLNCGFRILHLFYLHFLSSNNPLRNSTNNKIPFFPYIFIKDFFGFILILSLYLLQTHFGISSFSHPDNALEVCGLLTPLHIVPEWYFLCQYAMLKAVPNKNAGFIILLTSIFILLFFGEIRNLTTLCLLNNNGFSLSSFFSLSLSFLWIGSQFPQEKFLSYGRILTLYYYFLLMCILFSFLFCTVMDFFFMLLWVLSFGILFIWKLHQIHFVFLLIVLGY